MLGMLAQHYVGAPVGEDLAHGREHRLGVQAGEDLPPDEAPSLLLARHGHAPPDRTELRGIRRGAEAVRQAEPLERGGERRRADEEDLVPRPAAGVHEREPGWRCPAPWVHANRTRMDRR